MKTRKPTQNQIKDYLNLLHQNNSSLGLLRALRQNGFSDFEINKYLNKEGVNYNESMELIRKLNEES